MRIEGRMEKRSWWKRLLTAPVWRRNFPLLYIETRPRGCRVIAVLGSYSLRMLHFAMCGKIQKYISKCFSTENNKHKMTYREKRNNKLILISVIIQDEFKKYRFLYLVAFKNTNGLKIFILLSSTFTSESVDFLYSSFIAMQRRKESSFVLWIRSHKNNNLVIIHLLMLWSFCQKNKTMSLSDEHHALKEDNIFFMYDC